MIRCIAIDDEPLALVVISELCAKQEDVELVRTFTSASEAARYLRNFPVDLLFLDIRMPQNGIEFYRQHGQGKMVIFTTAYSEFAVDGFNVDAIDYLLKPVEQARFDVAIGRAREYYQFLNKTQTKNPALYVRSEYRLVKIETDLIDYIETMDDYLKIHIEGRKTVLTKMNLKNLMEKLDGDAFVRIHRSYVVPLKKTTSVRNREVEVAGVRLPIGESYMAAFRERFGKGS